MQNPKTGEVYDVNEEYDESSQTDVARDKAIAKGYVPVIDVVNPKSGQKYTIDDRSLDKALAKGYQTSENAENQQKVYQDRADRQRAQFEDGAKGKLLSAGKGLADVATYGFGDEIAGVKNALMNRGKNQDFSEAYSQGRDADRSLGDQAYETNPKSYIAGGAASIIPSLGSASAELPTFGKSVLSGMGEGAAFGLGNSRADNAGDIALDTAKGAAIGAASGAASHGLATGIGKLTSRAEEPAQEIVQNAANTGAIENSGLRAVGSDATHAIDESAPSLEPFYGEATEPDKEKIVQGWLQKKFKDRATKSLGSLTDSDPEMMQKYMANSEAVNAARPIDQMSADVVNNVEKLKDRVIKGSEAAVEKIPDDFRAPRSDIASIVEDAKNSLGKYTKHDIAARNELGAMQQRLKGNSALFNGEELSNMDFGSLNPSSLREEAYDMNGQEVKNFIKSLDQSIKESKGAGTFHSPLNQAYMKIRGQVDGLLKENAPEYANAMLDVAKDAQALNSASKHFPSWDQTTSKLKSAANRPEDKRDVIEALSNLDERLGTKFTSENDARGIKDYFSQDMSGGRGNRNKIVFGGLGGTAGAVFGPKGAAAGAYGGMKFGKYLDSHGRELAKVGMDKLADPESFNFLNKIESKIPHLPAKYQQALQSSIQKGGNAAAVTHFLLSSQHPDYRKHFEEDK